MATKLKNLVLNEVSLVDRGANQHAHVTLFKRDAAPLVKDIDAAIVGLGKSIETIIADEAADKSGALAETFKQYQAHLHGLVSTEIDKAITAAVDVAKSNSDKETKTMTDKVEDVAKKLAEVEAALAKANKELAFAKLSDAHKAYATEKALKDADLEAFVGKTAEGRDAHIAAAPVVKVVDTELAKREAKIADLEKRLEVREAAEIVASFAKRAVELELPEAKGEVLRKAYSGDVAAQGEIEALIKGLREQVKTGKVFEEFGAKTGGDATTPVAKINAKVAEMQKADPKLTRDTAIAKIAADPAQRDLWNEYKAA